MVALRLGRMGFRQALAVQNLLARALIEKHTRCRQEVCANKEEKPEPGAEVSGLDEVKGQNVVLFVEHDPVYTVGIRRKGYTDNDKHRLMSLGADYIETNRGGLVTFHGPGRLVAYPIIHLKDFRLGLRQYIENLEKTIIETCRGFGVEAGITPDTGVWVEDRKIATIGVHGSRYVTTHGVALNCNTDLTWFRHIVPCGCEGKGVTSLSDELGYDVSILETTEPFLEAFASNFGFTVTRS